MNAPGFLPMEDAAAQAGVTVEAARWLARTFDVRVYRVDGVEHVDPSELLRWTREDAENLAPAPTVARLSSREGLGGMRHRRR